MSVQTGFRWVVPPSALITEVEAYGKRIERAVLAVADLLAPVLEEYARSHATWTDRTGNARRGLTAVVRHASRDLVIVYLYHAMDYGKWLEIAHGGPYRIIVPTLTAHYAQVMRLLRQVLGG